jgi:hypothetical protein
VQERNFNNFYKLLNVPIWFGKNEQGRLRPRQDNLEDVKGFLPEGDYRLICFKYLNDVYFNVHR